MEKVAQTSAGRIDGSFSFWGTHLYDQSGTLGSTANDGLTLLWSHLHPRRFARRALDNHRHYRCGHTALDFIAIRHQPREFLLVLIAATLAAHDLERVSLYLAQKFSCQQFPPWPQRLGLR